MLAHAANYFNSRMQRVIDQCHMLFATLIDKKRGVHDDIKYT